MFHEESNILSLAEINTIKFYLSETNSEVIDNTYFDISVLPDGIYYEDINTLESKQVINTKDYKICNKCNTESDYCECEEPELNKKSYFDINVNTFIQYYFRNIEDLYDIKVINTLNIEHGIKGLFINNDGSEINFIIYFHKITDDYINTVQEKNTLFISLMRIENYEYEINLYEWHEILYAESYDRFKRKIKELFFVEKSMDYYILDLGDDIEVGIVETIRDTFRNYLLNHEYSNVTEPIKYRPEVLDYSLPNDKIKECFIKQNTKLFVIKPSEKEINIVHFTDGIINTDKNVYELIRKFDSHIKEKLHSYRKIKNASEHTNKIEIVIMLVTALANVFAGITGIFNKNSIFSKISEMLSSNLFTIIYVIINVIGILVIVQNIYVLMRFRYFSWSTKRLKSMIK
jgi:hypothetical protein